MGLWCNYLTTGVVIFTTSWDLLTSTANHGLAETFKTIVRLMSVLHYWPVLSYHELTALAFLPHLARSAKALREYSLAVMACSHAAREKNPSIKNVFVLFSSAKVLDTGSCPFTCELKEEYGKLYYCRYGSLSAPLNTSSPSHRTASSISATFFYLSHNPQAYDLVASEIRSAFPPGTPVRTGPTLNSCNSLRAAINEFMRMALSPLSFYGAKSNPAAVLSTKNPSPIVSASEWVSYPSNTTPPSSLILTHGPSRAGSWTHQRTKLRKKRD